VFAGQGAILILLSGPHRGKRVVCLGVLPSGLVLITGPFALNGCPVRRVNQTYVIVTSTKVDVSKVDTSAFTDAFFAKDAGAKGKKSTEDFGEQEAAAKEVPAARKAAQAKCDGAIKFDADMTLYMKSRFYLTKGQFPHQMKF
jgi:large subunit ribosomal protein L6e